MTIAANYRTWPSHHVTFIKAPPLPHEKGKATTYQEAQKSPPTGLYQGNTAEGHEPAGA